MLFTSPKERTLAQNIKMLDVSWYSLPIAHNWKVCCTCPSHRTLKRTTPNGNTSSHVNSLFLIMHGDLGLSLTYPVSNISMSYFNMVAIHSFTLLNIVLLACTDRLLSFFQIPMQSFFLNITFSVCILLLICTFPGLAINIGEPVGLLFPRGGCFSSV